MHAEFLLAVISMVVIYGYFRVTINIGGSNACVLNDSVTSVFDTCPLVLFNHMAPELLKFYHPDFNPKANCSIYKPLTKLINGRVRMEKKAKRFKCKARCILPAKPPPYNAYSATEWIHLPSNSVFQCDIVETECTKGQNKW
ncbi:hypothetical protein Y032_0003g1622 [Ancylostoma ceylanicum]|uniref:Uncharacterized protein n=1 Tax=Ancylostoma ceylanicum TaxID=53326 RepID=A0A016VYW6_9BILA|nr:hypothetical protein Y032_0003g1622 [Ancylostoma ceylanicum]